MFSPEPVKLSSPETSAKDVSVLSHASCHAKISVISSQLPPSPTLTDSDMDIAPEETSAVATGPVDKPVPKEIQGNKYKTKLTAAEFDAIMMPPPATRVVAGRLLRTQRPQRADGNSTNVVDSDRGSTESREAAVKKHKSVYAGTSSPCARKKKHVYKKRPPVREVEGIPEPKYDEDDSDYIFPTVDETDEAIAAYEVFKPTMECHTLLHIKRTITILRPKRLESSSSKKDRKRAKKQREQSAVEAGQVKRESESAEQLPLELGVAEGLERSQ